MFNNGFIWGVFVTILASAICLILFIWWERFKTRRFISSYKIGPDLVNYVCDRVRYLLLRDGHSVVKVNSLEYLPVDENRVALKFEAVLNGKSEIRGMVWFNKKCNRLEHIVINESRENLMKRELPRTRDELILMCTDHPPIYAGH